MVSGPRRRADVARGSACACDVALRPRGRAMAGPREAQVALTRGRRPRGRVHVGARVGRHVVGKDDNRRAHGYSGTLVREGGGNANYSMLALPLFNRFTSHYFLRVGLCPTRFLLVQDTWQPTGRRMRSGRQRSRGPKSTRSPKSGTCTNDNLSDTIKWLT